MKKYGTIKHSNNLIVPIRRISLSTGIIRLISIYDAKAVIRQQANATNFPFDLDISGEYEVYGEDGTLILVGWAEPPHHVNLATIEDRKEETFTLSVNNQKKTDNWMRRGLG